MNSKTFKLTLPSSSLVVTVDYNDELANHFGDELYKYLYKQAKSQMRCLIRDLLDNNIKEVKKQND